MEPHRLGALVAQMSAPFVLSDTEQSQVIASWFDLSEPEAVASTPQLSFPFCVHHGQMTVQQQGRHLICTLMLTLVWLQTGAGSGQALGKADWWPSLPSKTVTLLSLI